MAQLRVFETAPSWFRFEQIFKDIVGPIVLHVEGSFDTARLKVELGGLPVTITYVGNLDLSSGDIYQIRVEQDGHLWLRYGDEAPSRSEFSFSGGLETFQKSGLPASFLALEGDDFNKGNVHPNSLAGSAGNDTLDAGSGPDELHGGDGNDFLDGGPAADTMIGGWGDDSFVIDNSLDTAVELDGQGSDSIFSSVDYVLSHSASIEVLSGTGAGGLRLTGNNFNNTVNGNIGSDVLRGLAGDDRLFGDGGADQLIGDHGSDFLFGGLGNDKISGGDGNDTAYGDVGKDSISGGRGHDTLFGGTSNDTLRGGDNNDRLYGDVGNDVLYGDGGHDVLFGGLGTNRLSGGAGNDLVYGSSGKDVLFGNNGNDALHGDAGNDTLSGGSGSDTLSGGPGRDVFLFDTRLDQRRNVDRITDFKPQDLIQLAASAFASVGFYGLLTEEAFRIGRIAQDAGDRVLYDPSSGRLAYDADGSGVQSATLFARLNKGLHLTASDFFIV